MPGGCHYGFYQLNRRHSASNGLTPLEFEQYTSEVRKPFMT
jgi:hypothetical protein